MIYETARHWHEAPQKRVLFYGMSGLGKTHVSQMLRDAGGWFHYSIDYRIGTRYMGEFITDNAKAHFWWTIAERRNAPGAGENLDKLARTISEEDKQRAAAYLDQCAKATLRNCFPRNP